MRRTVLLAVLAVALLGAGGASAYALRTVFLKPGHCTKVHGTKVCARNVKPKFVTVTVAPSPVGQTFSGNGDKTLAPVTLAHGDTTFVEFDNGDSTTSGTSFIPPGTYTLDVSASAAWTISF